MSFASTRLHRFHRWSIFRRFAPLTIGLCVLAVHSTAWCQENEAVAAETPRFNRDIRPLLSSICVKCHGPDDEHRGADLRLDTPEGIEQAFGGGTDSSEAWARITSDDPDMVMRPRSTT